MGHQDIEMEHREAERLLSRLRRRQERQRLLDRISDVLLMTAGLLAFAFMVWGIIALQAPWVFL
jgi:hypothetical protein